MEDILRQLEEKRAGARAGGGARAGPGPARQGQAHRARAARGPARPQFLRRIRHVRRASLCRFGMAEQTVPSDGGRDGLGHHQRPPRLCFQPGFHRLRRQPLRGARRENLQGHRPGHEGGCARDRAQRFGRCPHPGGGGLARRLCRGVPTQRPRLGGGAADLRHHGAVRGRRRLFPGHDRHDFHGQGYVLHVRDRARGGEDRDPRRGHP